MSHLHSYLPLHTAKHYDWCGFPSRLLELDLGNFDEETIISKTSHVLNTIACTADLKSCSMRSWVPAACGPDPCGRGQPSLFGCLGSLGSNFTTILKQLSCTSIADQTTWCQFISRILGAATNTDVAEPSADQEFAKTGNVKLECCTGLLLCELRSV